MKVSESISGMLYSSGFSSSTASSISSVTRSLFSSSSASSNDILVLLDKSNQTEAFWSSHRVSLSFGISSAVLFGLSKQLQEKHLAGRLKCFGGAFQAL